MTRILITGAASGIGKACAQYFDATGAELVLMDRNEQALADVAGTHEFHAADVGDADFWAGFDPGPLDGAIVNAGIGSAAPITDLAFDDWRDVMAVNLDGAFLTLQSALRFARDSASIVTIAFGERAQGYSADCRLRHQQGRAHPPDEDCRRRSRAAPHPRQRHCAGRGRHPDLGSHGRSRTGSR